jgi:hypothetical protein
MQPHLKDAGRRTWKDSFDGPSRQGLLRLRVDPSMSHPRRFLRWHGRTAEPWASVCAAVVTFTT